MAAGSKTATYWNAQSLSYLPWTLVPQAKFKIVENPPLPLPHGQVWVKLGHNGDFVEAAVKTSLKESPGRSRKKKK